MPDNMVNLPADAFWYEQQKKPGFLARLRAGLPDLLQAGIAGAATPNIAMGGPTDIFRAMQAGGAEKDKKDLLAFKQHEAHQKDQALINERDSIAAYNRTRPEAAAANLSLRRDTLTQRQIYQAGIIADKARRANTADAKLEAEIEMKGWERDTGQQFPTGDLAQNQGPETQGPPAPIVSEPDGPPAPVPGSLASAITNPMAPRPKAAPPQQATVQAQDQPATGQFDTPLSPDEENAFQQWKQKNAPNDSGQDYDLRGAFKAGLEPDPQTGHWPDTFKKPNHPTFSVESQYAKDAPDKAGHWEGPNHDQYVPAGAQADVPETPQDQPDQPTPADVTVTPTQPQMPPPDLRAQPAPRPIFPGLQPPAPPPLMAQNAPPAQPPAPGIFPGLMGPSPMRPKLVKSAQLKAQDEAKLLRTRAQAGEAASRDVLAQTRNNQIQNAPVKQTNQQKLDQFKKDHPELPLTKEQEARYLMSPNGTLPAVPRPPAPIRGAGAESVVPMQLTPQQEQLLGVKRPVSGDRNEEFLRTLPTDAQTYIKGLADYDIEPPSQYRQTRDPQAGIAILRAKQYDPSYDSKEYPARRAMLQDFKSNKRGSTGGNISSLNTLTRHIASMQELAEAMQTRNTQLVNRIVNRISTELGDPSVTNFDSAKDAVSTELSTALKGQATEADIKAWRDTINPASSPAQLVGGTKTKLGLMLSRLKSIQDSYYRGMGGKQYPLLDRETADTFIKYGLNPGEADSRFSRQDTGAGGGAGKITVTDPTGKPHYFDTAAQAEAFKKLAPGSK